MKRATTKRSSAKKPAAMKSTSIKTTKVLIKTASTDWTNSGRCKCWVHGTADGYIYISGPNNRSYYLLNRLTPKKIPRIAFSEKSQRITVGGMHIQFKRAIEFEFFRDALQPFAAKRSK